MNQNPHSEREQEEALEELEKGLLGTINTLSDLNVMIETFNSDAEHNWFLKLNTLLDNYRNIKDIGRAYDFVPPQPVIDHIDNGTSPTQFMGLMQNFATERCDLTNGRQNTFTVCYNCNNLLIFSELARFDTK
jgi:hypothetical protein